MEGLARLCEAINLNIPIIGYITNGFLPEGIKPTPIDDIRWVITSITNQHFYEIEDYEMFKVKRLYIPELPIILSQSCSEPWRMTNMITKIVTAARLKHPNINQPINDLYLKRYEEIELNHDITYSDPTSELSRQIANISYTKKLTGLSGSNTHASIFANHNTLTEWKSRGNFIETDRNQSICDIVKSFNNY
jgi:hypothetical protein